MRIEAIDARLRFDVHIRWMIRRDFPEVLDIEAASSPLPWNEDDFLDQIRKRNCIGMVAERGMDVVGFMLYTLNPKHIEVVKFAVSPASRRCGVGRQMVARLAQKLSPHRRQRIVLDCRESLTIGHLFLRSCGFLAVSVSRCAFQDTGEDAYRFELNYDDLKEY